MIVLDNSALVAALVENGPRSRAVRTRLVDEDVVVPALVDLELASALRGMVAGGKLATADAARAISAWSAQAVERVPHHGLLERVWQLRDNLTPYDAVYVALAETLDASLVTLDGRMANAPGIRCAVELIT